MAGTKADIRNDDGTFNNEFTEQLTGTTADLRIGSKSDPICSSAGCTQYEHPHPSTHKMNYFVPNFGKDHNIVQSDESAQQAEEQLGHTWTPTFDEEKDEWVVPTETAEFRLAGVNEDMHIKKKHHHRHSKHGKKSKPSDPSCTSSGWCGESLWPTHRAKEDEHAVLRSDTQRGANQVPTKQEKEDNVMKVIMSRPDPHPSTDLPEDEDP